jgi:hypothetical protein
MSALPAYRLDAVTIRSGLANSLAFRGIQQRYGRALHVTKSTASRHFKGENAPSTQFLAFVASADEATAFPYLIEAWGLVNQKQIREATTAELHARLAEIDDEEHGADGVEDRERFNAALNPTPTQRRASAAADRRVAALYAERAEIMEEIALREEHVI